MGLNYGDLDNDGWLDLYIGTGNPEYSTLVPNRMFRNDGGRRFQDVTTAGNFGHLQKGHGIAWGDVDNDGDQDVFEEMGGAYQSDRAYSALYENPHAKAGAADADWVSLELEGTTANRGAHRRPRHGTPADAVRTTPRASRWSARAAASDRRRCASSSASAMQPRSPAST